MHGIGVGCLEELELRRGHDFFFLFFQQVLKNIDLSYNNLGDEGRKAIHDAVSGREGFELEM